jgi:hypothetical protein
VSVLDRIVEAVQGRRNGSTQAQPAPPGPPPLAVGPGELSRRRDRLARQLAELQWDLGGLTYEMAIRDHFRLDVLLRKAAQLQEVDVELGEVERLLGLEEAGAAGSCPNCGSLYARGAMFCAQCGNKLMETRRAGPTAPPESERFPRQ